MNHLSRTSLHLALAVSSLTLVLLAGGASFAAAQDGWVEQASPTGQYLRDVDFLDSQTGWICGSAGTILHTTDAGTTWATQISQTGYGLYGISFVDESLGLAVGQGGTILRTEDGGETWVVIRTDWMDTLYDVHFYDEQHAWAVGVNAIFAPFVGYSTDGGESWSFTTFYIQNNEATLRGVRFVSETVGFAAGSLWDGRGAVCRTTDGGLTWTTQIVFGNAMACIDMASDMVGSAAGMNGSVLRTGDGGDNWSNQYVGSSAFIWGIAAPDEAITFCVGDGGLITRTGDGGSTWEPQDSGTSVTLEGIDFIDPLIGTVVGDGGTILRTETGGTLPSNAPDIQPMPTAALRLLPGGVNPFDQVTQILFETPRTGQVHIEVLDLAGRLVRSQWMHTRAGRHTWSWDGTDAAGRQVGSGTYYCRLRVDGAPGTSGASGAQATKTLLHVGH